MTFNSELATRTLDLIRLHPENHVQGQWRCSTGQCFAGWTAVALEFQWVMGPEHRASMYYDWVYVPEEFMKQHGSELNTQEYEYDPDAEMHMMHVAEAARVALGLRSEEARYLFNGNNTRECLEAYVKVAENEPDLEARTRKLRKEFEDRFETRYTNHQ